MFAMHVWLSATDLLLLLLLLFYVKLQSSTSIISNGGRQHKQYYQRLQQYQAAQNSSTYITFIATVKRPSSSFQLAVVISIAVATAASKEKIRENFPNVFLLDYGD